MFKKILYCAFFVASMNKVAFAEDVQVVGTIQVKQPTQSLKKPSKFNLASTEYVALLKIALSSDAKQAINNRIRNKQMYVSAKSTPSSQYPQYPQEIQLNMNGVPVLNQGSHGTCVTFATTAAVDAILGKGDYISQLCQLELGRYLENNTYTSSGWDGSWGRIILSQMDVFGMVSKAYQRANGCAGIKEYPLSGEEPTAEESLVEFHQISEPLPKDQIAWSSIMEAYQVSSDQIDENNILMEVKKALNAGDRLTFGVLLLDFDQGAVGAVGSYHGKFDTWVLTPEIANDLNDQAEFAGHEMVITGYDDNATAFDTQGRAYKGLLTLRNSWGGNVGDKGNFYMSYDYFKGLMLEVQRIRHLS